MPGYFVALMYSQNGVLTNLLKLARKKFSRVPGEGGGGGASVIFWAMSKWRAREFKRCFPNNINMDCCHLKYCYPLTAYTTRHKFNCVVVTLYKGQVDVWLSHYLRVGRGMAMTQFWSFPSYTILQTELLGEQRQRTTRYQYSAWPTARNLIQTVFKEEMTKCLIVQVIQIALHPTKSHSQTIR